MISLIDIYCILQWLFISIKNRLGYQFKINAQNDCSGSNL